MMQGISEEHVDKSSDKVWILEIVGFASALIELFESSRNCIAICKIVALFYDFASKGFSIELSANWTSTVTK